MKYTQSNVGFITIHIAQHSFLYLSPSLKPPTYIERSSLLAISLAVFKVAYASIAIAIAFILFLLL